MKYARLGMCRPLQGESTGGDRNVDFAGVDTARQGLHARNGRR